MKKMKKKRKINKYVAPLEQPQTQTDAWTKTVILVSAARCKRMLANIKMHRATPLEMP
jgi:hypothetical protein